jgi:hypothetical protein
MAGLNNKNTKLGCLHIISILLGLLITFILGYSWVIDSQIPPLFVILVTVWLIMMGLSPLMPPKSAFLLIPLVFILYAITSIETGAFDFRSIHISYQNQPVKFIVHVGFIVVVGIFCIIYVLRAKVTSNEINTIEKDKPNPSFKRDA